MAIKERRIFERFDILRDRSKLLLPPDTDLLNVSLGGIAVQMQRRIRKGDEVNLLLKDGVKIPIKTVAVWSVYNETKSDKGYVVASFHTGLKFKDMFPAHFRKLVEFLCNNFSIGEEGIDQ